MARKREAFDRALGRRCVGGLLLALVVAASPGFAQQEAEAGVTLGAAITTALEVFSEVEASRADVSAAEEEVGVAKKAYLPSGEIYAQWNRASRNNVYGLLLPGGTHPSISGPVIEETTSRSAWGSLASVVLRWDVYNFGARAADVDEAEALHGRAEAGLRATELDVALGVIDDFVAVVGAESAFAAAAATLERMKVFETGISVLVENELRAGADISFARAELARARIEMIRAEQVRDEARMSLSEWLGRAGDRVEIDASHLMDTAPESPRSTTLGEEAGEHPLLLFREADVEAAKARRESASRQYRPSLELLAAFYSRGTSAMLDGGFEGGSAGAVARHLELGGRPGDQLPGLRFRRDEAADPRRGASRASGACPLPDGVRSSESRAGAVADPTRGRAQDRRERPGRARRRAVATDSVARPLRRRARRCDRGGRGRTTATAGRDQ